MLTQLATVQTPPSHKNNQFINDNSNCYVKWCGLAKYIVVGISILVLACCFFVLLEVCAAFWHVFQVLHLLILAYQGVYH